MRVTKYSFAKSFTKGMPNYSSIKTSYGFDVEVEAGEQIDKKAIWKQINLEITNNMDLEEEWLELQEDKGKKTAYNNFKKGQ